MAIPVIVPKAKCNPFQLMTYLYNGLEEFAVSSAEDILTAWSLTSVSADCMESVLTGCEAGWSWSSLMVSWFITRPRSLLATCRDNMSPGCTLPPTSSKHNHGVITGHLSISQ